MPEQYCIVDAVDPRLPLSALHDIYAELCANTRSPGKIRRTLRCLSPNDMWCLRKISPSLMLVAAAHGSPATLLLLVMEFGFDWKTQLGDSGNIFMWAVRHNNMDVIELLLAYDVAEIPLSAVTSLSERNALHVAAEAGAEEAVKAILESLSAAQLFPIDATDHEGDTALHIATAKGHKAIVKLLLDAGARVDVMNRRARLPLHDAIDSSSFGLIAALVPPESTPTYYTPQQYAVSSNRLDDASTIVALQRLGASPVAGRPLTGCGMDLIALAVKRGKSETAAFLKLGCAPQVVPLPFR